MPKLESHYTGGRATWNTATRKLRKCRGLAAYVRKGGRLVLLPRSGRYALEDGRPDFPLLKRLGQPKQAGGPLETWSHGKGQVMRVTGEMEWSSPQGTQTLIKLMEWLRVERPVMATPGVLATVSRGRQGQLYVTLLRQKPESGSGTFQLRAGLLAPGQRYRVANLFEEKPQPLSVETSALEKGFPLSFTAHELKVLRLTPE